MQASPSVLIVDRNEENREVLSTVLERRGIRTFAAARAARGAEIARSLHPDLIVVDLDQQAAGPEQVCSRLAGSADSADVPMVLLGSAKLPPGYAPGEIVAKPYHYAPLIRRIEEILAAAERKSAA